MIIDENNFYTKDELLSLVPVTYECFRFWIDDGLSFIPTGADDYLVRGIDLINYLRQNTVTRQKLEEDSK